MAPKILFYLLAAAATFTSVTAVAIPEPSSNFVIPEDVEILDLRTDEDKALVRPPRTTKVIKTLTHF